MTWVVGGRHVGCARCIADMQVTVKFPDNCALYFDAVQKIHPIGPGLVIAFAGSIKVALKIIKDLRDKFYGKLDKRLFASPIDVATKTVKAIKFFYNQSGIASDNYVEFLLLIAPTGTYTEFGAFKFVSPEFTIVCAKRPFELLQLGSGSTVKEYQNLVKQHETPGYEIPGENGELPTLIIPAGKKSMEFLFSQATDYQNAGISKSMHVCRLSHNKTLIELLPDNPPTDFPEVAKSWGELKQILREKGVNLAACRAEA